jgi:histidyl-tRNA synthetase
MKAQMKLANRSGARFALIVGDDELAAGTVVVKPDAGGDQSPSPDPKSLPPDLVETHSPIPT